MEDPSVIGMMPLMHFRTIDDILQFTAPHIYIGVDIHAPYRIQQSLDGEDHGIGAQHDDRCELHRLVDDDLQCMRAGARQPVHLLIGMMRFMGTPEYPGMMLPPVEPINIKIMHHQEEKHLPHQGPGADKMQGG